MDPPLLLISKATNNHWNSPPFFSISVISLSSFPQFRFSANVLQNLTPLLVLMTGDLNQTLKCSCKALFIFLFIFLLSSSHTVSSPVSSSSTRQIQPQNDPSSSVPVIPTHYQVFDLKNNDPIFQERFKKRLKKKKKKHRKKTAAKNLIKPRPFSVMLPKGFVPPSRSSPWHNEYPTSMNFQCHLDHNN